MAVEQIVFLQDHEAEEAFEILGNDGENALMEYLKQWHYPGEHDRRAESGAGSSDDVTEEDGYILAVNTGLEYVGLEYDEDHHDNPSDDGEIDSNPSSSDLEQYQKDVSDLADEILQEAIDDGEPFSEALTNWAISQAEQQITKP